MMPQLQAKLMEYARALNELRHENTALRAANARYLQRIADFDKDQTSLRAEIDRLTHERDGFLDRAANAEASHTEYRNRLRAKLHEALDV
jgi:chromosome segregation ATPase